VVGWWLGILRGNSHLSTTMTSFSLGSEHQDTSSSPRASVILIRDFLLVFYICNTIVIEVPYRII
jgi:hypothetical protein